MKKRIYNQTSLFGPLYAFLVVISPPDDVKQKIAAIKKQLNDFADIGERNLKSIAHITLTDKLTDDADFAVTIASLIKGQQPYAVTINGWDYFDHGHSVTVYLKIVTPEPIITIAELLKSTAKTPHISLAKRIPRETFERLKLYLDQLDFTATWTCTEVTVLRKLIAEKHLGWRESFKVGLGKIY